MKSKIKLVLFDLESLCTQEIHQEKQDEIRIEMILELFTQGFFVGCFTNQNKFNAERRLGNAGILPFLDILSTNNNDKRNVNEIVIDSLIDFETKPSETIIVSSKGEHFYDSLGIKTFYCENPQKLDKEFFNNIL